MDKIPEIIRSCCLFDQGKSKIVAFYEGNVERKRNRQSIKAVFARVYGSECISSG